MWKNVNTPSMYAWNDENKEAGVDKGVREEDENPVV